MRECQPDQVLFDYLQKELRPEQAARIEVHLPECAACRDALKRLQQEINQVHATLAQLDPATGGRVRPQPELVRVAGRPRITPSRRPAIAFSGVVFVLAMLVVLVRIGGRTPADSNTTNQTQNSGQLAVEAEWPEDAQRDWDDQNIMIQVVDRENRTVEVMRASLRSGKVKPLQLTGAAAQ